MKHIAAFAVVLNAELPGILHDKNGAREKQTELFHRIVASYNQAFAQVFA